MPFVKVFLIAPYQIPDIMAIDPIRAAFAPMQPLATEAQEALRAKAVQKPESLDQAQSKEPKTREQLLAEANESLKAWSTAIRIERDEISDHLVVLVLDAKTGETLKRIPSDAVIKVARVVAGLQESTQPPSSEPGPFSAQA